jgi:hypothetical protein
MTKEFNAYQFEAVYDDLELDSRGLGYVMLDTEPVGELPIPKEYLYYHEDPDRHIQGLVSAQTPHVTLLGGILPGVKKWHVDSVLEDWWVKQIGLLGVEVFDSPDNSYYCIVVRVATDELIEAHQRLSLLPHINAFPGYKAHLTLAYIKHDEEMLKKTLDIVAPLVEDNYLDTVKINYGNKIGE